MRHLTVSILVILAVLLGSAGEGWSLPPCADTSAKSVQETRGWDNCFGTISAYGDNYVGEFKDGKFNGQGTYTFASGEKHVGEWKNSLPNGMGVHTYADGRVEEGMFENGKFLYAKKP